MIQDASVVEDVSARSEVKIFPTRIFSQRIFFPLGIFFVLGFFSYEVFSRVNFFSRLFFLPLW
jgi:hypothetical protein